MSLFESYTLQIHLIFLFYVNYYYIFVTTLLDTF